MFTIRLADALNRRGIRAEITWLPHGAEYMPWIIPIPELPAWATIVHINTWLHTRFFAHSNLPVLATCHGCVHDAALAPYKSLSQTLYHRYWVRRLESNSLSSAGCITSVSRYTAQRLAETFHMDQIEIIPNWLPDDAFVPTLRPAASRPFRLLYVGKWSRRKGADLLPEIMSWLGEDFELHFTGTPLKNSESPANMTPLGWSSEPAIVRRWMCEADALLFPSRMEGLPLAVLEALACGLPVITSNSASLPELIEHGKNGLLCPVDDILSFVTAARQMRDHPEQWQSMQATAYANAWDRHSETPAIEAYLRLYRKLAASRSSWPHVPSREQKQA